MTSPVSIGDAFLMAKLALKIGRALTQGRNSALAEFREVESQLYSLSVALEALASAHESNQSISVDRSSLPKRVPSHFTKEQDVVLGILRSCKETLTHLDALLDRYSVITEASEDGGRSFSKRWGRELKLNWRKIVWTTEGGDLAALKTNLIVYTNSLNLVLGVLLNSQTGRLENSLNHVSSMLQEIHEWFVENVKNAAAARAPANSGSTSKSEDIDRGRFPELRCEVYRQFGQHLILVCPRASLTSDAWDLCHSTSPQDVQLLTCHCSDTTANPSSHQAMVAAYRLSPTSFASRVAGKERSWLLYALSNRTTEQIGSLVIKKVPPQAMYDFEELVIHCIGVSQTRQTYSNAMTTTDTNMSLLDLQHSAVNVLNIVGNSANSQGSINAVRFSYGNRHYLRSSIDSIQVLHYKAIGLDNLMEESALLLNAFENSKEAEVTVIFGQEAYNPRPDKVVRSVVTMIWDTIIELQAETDTILLKDIYCKSFDIEGNPSTATRATVSLVFMDPAVASSFHQELESVRMDLFVIHLQDPRPHETSLLSIQAKDVHTERMHIREAEMMILQSSTKQEYRLLVRSKRGHSVISQELREGFFGDMASTGYPNFDGITYEVFLDDSGNRRVRKCPKGFSYLVFSDSKIEQVFNLGLSAIAGPVRLENESGEEMALD